MNILTHQKKLHVKIIAVVAVLFGFLMTTEVYAQSRRIYVNGIRMTDKQVSQLEYYACTPIPNGNYWMNLLNGAWGYFGNFKVQGYFGDQCKKPGNAQAYQRRQSLSERGMLYSPGEILSGR